MQYKKVNIQFLIIQIFSLAGLALLGLACAQNGSNKTGDSTASEQVLDTMKADDTLRHIPVIVITAKDLTTEDYRRLSGKVESLLQKGEFMEEELFDSITDVLK